MEGMGATQMVRFMIAGDLDYCEQRPDTYVQISAPNTADLLRWLWLDPCEFGFLEATDLAARCKRRLWPLPRNFDAAVPNREETTANGNVRLIVCGREAGYLRSRTEDLLRLAERAGPEGQILFS